MLVPRKISADLDDFPADARTVTFKGLSSDSFKARKLESDLIIFVIHYFVEILETDTPAAAPSCND